MDDMVGPANTTVSLIITAAFAAPIMVKIDQNCIVNHINSLNITSNHGVGCLRHGVFVEGHGAGKENHGFHACEILLAIRTMVAAARKMVFIAKTAI
jgi:hypothetical protein